MLNKTIAALSTALMVGVFSINSTYAQTTTVVGAIPGEFDVSGGSATYSIPISVAPGRGGMQPELSLNYSSGGGNGVLGIAWSLRGLSAIHRCPRTIAQDGQVGSINFDGNDRYCLDGQRLIPVVGSNGGIGTEYKTEIDGYSRVVSHGGSVNNPLYWVIKTKAGQVMIYGDEPGDVNESTLEYAQGNMSWSIKEINDTTSSNPITYSYLVDTYNSQYLDEITYAGGSVDIVYENGRPDQVPSYFLGQKTIMTQRVDKVVVYADSNHLLREYRIKYQNSSSESISKITEVTTCDSNNNCLSPLVFDWEDTNTDFAPISYYENNGVTNNAIVDVNGDGSHDICSTTQYNPGLEGVMQPEGYTIYPMHCSIFIGQDHTEVIVSELTPWSSSHSKSNTFVDFNGDGLSDFCSTDSVYRLPRISCTLASSSGFGDIITTNADWGTGDARQWVDFNGDGLTDYCRITDSTNAQLRCNLSAGGSFGAVVNSPSMNWGSKEDGQWWIDINGDGLTDFCRILDSSPGKELHCLLSAGDTFGESVSYPVYDQGFNWTDFNGDGLLDYCRTTGTENLHDSRARCTLSTGDGFGETIASDVIDWGYSWWGNSESVKQIWQDINGDGYSDFCRVAIDEVQMICTLSTGDSFGETISTGVIPGYIRDWGRSVAERGFFDVNGNGELETCKLSASGLLCVEVSSGLSSKISTITDSNGNTIQLTYKPLTDSSVYTKGSGAVFPVQDVQSAYYVVSDVETSDGIGGITNVQYQYEGLREHAQGRGSYGFAKITEIYPATGKTNVTTFDQRDFPYTNGVLSTVESYNGQKINESVNTYVASVNATGVHQLNLEKTVQTSYELNSSQPVTTVTTEYNDIDFYGNVGLVRVTTTGGGQTFVKTTYSDYETTDTTNWILGRLSKSIVEHIAPNQAPEFRGSAFEYYDQTGLLQSESIVRASSSDVNVLDTSNPLTTTTYQYNNYGQTTEVRVSTPVTGYEDRVTTTHYYPDQVSRSERSCNAYNQCETYTYTVEGWLDTSTGPNGITTSWEYDGFGRKILENRADGTSTSINRYFTGSGNCVPSGGELAGFAYTCKVTQTSGSQAIYVQYDKLGREVRTIKTGFDGRLVYSDTEYNHLAQVSRVSREYYSGDQRYWATSRYDVLDRITQVSEPGPHGSTVNVVTEYNGLVTTVRSGPEAHIKTITNNAVGQKVRIDEETGTYTEYSYNSDGNLLTTRVAGNDSTIITLHYDDYGRKDWMDDPDMGRWDYTYTPFGELETQTDAKNQMAVMEYDRLGRMISRTQSEGISTWEYYPIGAPAGSVGKLYRESGNGLTKTYSYDSLGRLDSVLTDIAGQGSFTTETTYDSLGRVKRTIYPGSQNFWTENVYNSNGFLAAVQGARAQAEPHDYTELQPLIQDAVNLADAYLAQANELRSLGAFYQSQIEYYQSLTGSGAVTSSLQSQLIQHQSNLNSTISQGQTTSTKQLVNQFIPIMVGDILVPIVHYRQSIALSPELLGHINNSIIELQEVNSLINTQSQSYEAIAEQLIVLAEQTLAAADHNFEFVSTLDNAAAVYGDFDVEASTNTITYWRAADVDASGRISAEVYGNGIVNDYAYNKATGQLQSIHSGLLVVDALRHLEYQYDAYQNVTLRHDMVNDIRETYEYDRLDRLTDTYVSSNLYDTPEFNNVQTQSYDELGNIVSKSDVGSYTYIGFGPHAVSHAGNKSYIYDANGNMTSGDGRTIQWSSFNKPTHITQDGRSATFSYGPNHSRFKKVNHQGDTTLYLGIYERTIRDSGNEIEQKHYIYAAGQLIAEHIVSTSEGVQTRYLHKDALGSIDMVTDAYANVVDRRSFDAWGKLRNLPWQSQAGLDDPLYLTQLPFTDKGYTGHEHVQEVDLIHMNGRMYDANLARFISADPLIQAASLSQSYNRYSYVMNNPMKYTDPSGYSWISKAWKKFKRSAKKFWNKARPYAGIIVGAVISLYCTVCGSAITKAAIAGAAAGAVSAAANGGNILRGAVTGAFSGAVFGAIGASGLGDSARILAHGVAGGVMSVIQGGKFGTGFMSAGFTKFVTLRFSQANVLGMGSTNQSFGRVAGRTAVAAVVGGTASKIGGGKFANGAKTAAMAHLFNAEGQLARANAAVREYTLGVWKKLQWNYNAVANGLRDDFSGGFVEGMINFTGGRSESDFISEVNENYFRTSIVAGPLSNIDKTITSITLGGAVTESYGGYTLGKLVMKGPAPHLGTYSASARLAIASTAINSFLFTTVYEASNYAGSLVRIGANRAFRAIGD